MKKPILILLLSLTVCMSACAGKAETTVTSAFTESTAETSTSATEATTTEGAVTTKATVTLEPTVTETESESSKEKTMVLKIGEKVVPVTWEENDSVTDLKALAQEGLTIEMTMYGGFEQVGPIGKSISRDDVQTDTSSGDIVLYSGNQIVIFYGSNSWAYTRLGKISLSENEMKDLLSNGDVTITLTVE